MFLINAGIIHCLHPISIRIGHIVRITGFGDTVRIFFFLAPEVDHCLGKRKRGVNIFRRLIHNGHVVSIIGYDLEFAGRLIDSHHAAICNAELAGRLGSVFRSYENHAVGSSVSINGT